MSIELKDGNAARKLVLKGIKKLEKAVGVTLGARGKNVGIEGRKITKDGVSVAKCMSDKDPYVNYGMDLIKDVAVNTDDIVHDGTTTATVIASAMCQKANQNIVAGANPMEMKKGLEKATKVVVDFIKSSSIPVLSDSKKIREVAIVSANGDEVIGELIADAVKEVKETGLVRVEEGKGVETRVEFLDGMEYESGWMTPYFINSDRAECVLDNPYILLCEKPIAKMEDVVKVLEPIAKQGRSLLIIAENVEGEAFPTFVKNAAERRLKVCCVKAKGTGDEKIDLLEDVAAKTGATLISESKGVKLKECGVEILGQADKIVVGQKKTTIIGGKGDASVIEKRIDNISTIKMKATGVWEKEQLDLRSASLKGGVAVIHVGAVSEQEVKEKRDRVDDAVGATKAAMEEGIVSGGGVIYLRALKSLKSLKTDSRDEEIGVELVRSSLEAPLRRMIANAEGAPDVVVDKVKKGKGNFGYNVRTEKYCDLVEDGIIDPAKVSRVALENAASIAWMFMTTEVVIVDGRDNENQ